MFPAAGVGKNSKVQCCWPYEKKQSSMLLALGKEAKFYAAARNFVRIPKQALHNVHARVAPCDWQLYKTVPLYMLKVISDDEMATRTAFAGCVCPLFRWVQMPLFLWVHIPPFRWVHMPLLVGAYTPISLGDFRNQESSAHLSIVVGTFQHCRLHMTAVQLSIVVLYFCGGHMKAGPVCCVLVTAFQGGFVSIWAVCS